jgi:hypothetical protein
MKNLLGGAGVLGAWLLCGLSACGQGSEPRTSESTSSTTDALNGVLGCQAQAFACAADAAPSPAAVTSCQSDLRSCLMGLLPDAGALPPQPSPPTLPGLPTLDAGLPTLPGLPTKPLDAGLPTKPGLPAPPTLPDAGFPTQAQCLLDLQICLGAGTTPTTCATTAQTCLKAAEQTQCDDQEKACLAAGLPAAACDAQRKACP